MKVKYKHYVISDCPRCGSVKTGRFIYCDPTKSLDIVNRNLKKGNRIRAVYSLPLPALNCYCEDCGQEWRDINIVEWMSKEEWNKFCEYKLITQSVNDFERSIEQSKCHGNEKLEQIKKEKRKKVFYGTLFFLTGYRRKEHFQE